VGARLADRLVAAVEWGAAMCLALITVMTFVSVIMRYLFVAPLPDDFDFSRLVLGIAILWGLAGAFYRGEHIQVDLVWTALPRWGRVGVDVLASLVSLVFLTVFAWMMFDRVAHTRAAHMTTVELGVPIWPFYGAAWLGIALAVLLVPVYLARAVRRPRRTP
jgi:TRAP-type transport system small permease protein